MLNQKIIDNMKEKIKIIASYFIIGLTIGVLYVFIVAAGLVPLLPVLLCIATGDYIFLGLYLIFIAALGLLIYKGKL